MTKKEAFAELAKTGRSGYSIIDTALDKIAELEQQLAEREGFYEKMCNDFISLQHGDFKLIALEAEACRRAKEQLAEREKERRGVIAESKMHPSWLEKSKEELLDALRFQGATTASLLEETDGYRKQIVMLREALIHHLNAPNDPDAVDDGFAALAATQDLSGLVMCDAKPVMWVDAKTSVKSPFTTDIKVPLYQERKP